MQRQRDADQKLRHGDLGQELIEIDDEIDDIEVSSDSKVKEPYAHLLRILRRKAQKEAEKPRRLYGCPEAEKPRLLLYYNIL